MLKATIFIQRKEGDGCQDDDLIRIYDVNGASGILRVVFTTPDLRKSRQFYMGQQVVMDYILDVLKSLQYDAVPFEFVQVSTTMHPSVVYHVSDLDVASVRHVIEDLVYTAIKTPVAEVKTPTSTA